MDEVHLPALFGDGGDAAVHLEGGGAFIFVAIATEEAEESRGECLPGSGKGFEDSGVGVFGGGFFDEAIEA